MVVTKPIEKDIDEDNNGSKMNSLVDMTGLPLVKAITIDRVCMVNSL